VEKLGKKSVPAENSVGQWVERQPRLHDDAMPEFPPGMSGMADAVGFLCASRRIPQFLHPSATNLEDESTEVPSQEEGQMLSDLA
jgi:hypothetical protein